MEIFQIAGQLLGVALFLFCGERRRFQCLLHGVHCFVVRLGPLEPGLLKELGAAVIRHADELCFSIILVGAGNGFRLGHQAVQNGRGGFVRRVCSCRDLDGVFLQRDARPRILPVQINCNDQSRRQGKRRHFSGVLGNSSHGNVPPCLCDLMVLKQPVRAGAVLHRSG